MYIYNNLLHKKNYTEKMHLSNNNEHSVVVTIQLMIKLKKTWRQICHSSKMIKYILCVLLTKQLQFFVIINNKGQGVSKTLTGRVHLF